MLEALTFYLFAGITLASAMMVITARNPVHSVFFLILSFFSSAGIFVLLGAEFLAMLLVVVYVGAVAVLFLFVVMMLDMPVPTLKTWFIPDMKHFAITAGLLLSYGVVFLGTMYLMMVALSYVSMLGLGTSGFSPSELTVNPLAALREPFAKFEFHSWWEFTIAASILLLALLAARALASTVLKRTFWRVCGDFISQAPVGLIVSIALLLELSFVLQVGGDTDFAREMALLPILPDNIIPNTHAMGQVLYTEYLYIFQTAGLILLVAMIGAIVLTQRSRSDAKKQDIYLQNTTRKEDVIELKKVALGEGVSKWN